MNDLKEISGQFERLRLEVGHVVVGQEKILDRLLIALVCRGHVLLEGVPGIAKTTLVRTLASAIGADFHRISFTPDLLPADVTGTQIFNQKDGSFSAKKGPVFTNLLLADEINRAPAKVQSALLEAMQERQVTIGDDTFPLPEPFLVLATQNPIEQEGTYPLPEAQVDRFLFKVIVPMPSREDEMRIMTRFSRKTPPVVTPVLQTSDIANFRDALDEVYCDEKVAGYILDLVFATREPDKHGLKNLAGFIDLGASPRASINLNLAARANALLHGRAYATPQDVKEVAPDVLRHRIQLSYEAEARDFTAEKLIREILDSTPVP
ncbi:MAG: AAA family ATPase [Kiritimatiellia bacterium]